MKKLPRIKSVMTPFPWSIDIDAPVDEARAFMRREHIRHLPVVDEGRLVGLVSDRDIKLCLGPDFDSPPPGEVTVRDVYVDRPYVVELDEPLPNVLFAMAERHIGSVLVTREGKLAGVFTATDACRRFAEFLTADAPRPGGEAA